MSKPVRIRGDVAAQVELVAARERRSFANAVEVLLLQALAAEVPAKGGGSVAYLSGQAAKAVAEGGGNAVPPTVHADGVSARPHMKKNRPAVECPTRWPSGVCPDCGQVIDG